MRSLGRVDTVPCSAFAEASAGGAATTVAARPEATRAPDDRTAASLDFVRIPRPVPGLPPRLPVKLDELATALEAAGVRHDHEVVAALRRRHERLFAQDGGHPDRRVRFLDRARHEMHVGKRVEPARVGDPVFGPESGDDVHAFLEAGATLLHAHPEDFELFRDEGPPEAHVQPAVAQVVEHGQLSGQFHGIVEGRDHRTGDGPQAPGASGDRREEHHRVRRMPAILVEVVLHGLDGVVPQLVGTLGETQTLGEVLRRGVVAEAEGREEVETEPHRYAPFATSSR